MRVGFFIARRNTMATPNYKLKDYHAVTAKHMRDERARNDGAYATKTELLDHLPDSITHANG